MQKLGGLGRPAAAAAVIQEDLDDDEVSSPAPTKRPAAAAAAAVAAIPMKASDVKLMLDPASRANCIQQVATSSDLLWDGCSTGIAGMDASVAELLDAGTYSQPRGIRLTLETVRHCYLPPVKYLRIVRAASMHWHLLRK